MGVPAPPKSMVSYRLLELSQIKSTSFTYIAEAAQLHPARITKVSALFGVENELYEEALRSHERHNELHGYDLKILRERLISGYGSKPAYMLSLILGELAKPEAERSEWFMWIGPDCVLLNPLIPADIFLPPHDFDRIYFLGTHGVDGVDTGVYFLRVHHWSVRMLIDVLAAPPDQLDAAFGHVVATDLHREHVLYQPRRWYNAYQLSPDKYEGKEGDMMVHFSELEGDEWSAMAKVLDQLSQRQDRWQKKLDATTYEREVAEYWDRLRLGKTLLRDARKQAAKEPKSDDGHEGGEEQKERGEIRRLAFALSYEADKASVLEEAINGVKRIIGEHTP